MFRPVRCCLGSSTFSGVPRKCASKMRLFVARHAEREDVVNRTWTAQTERQHDPPISRKGELQAQRLGQRIRSSCEAQNCPTVLIYCSPLLRCVQTAVHASSTLGAGFGTQIIIENGLIDCPGEFKRFGLIQDPIVLPLSKLFNRLPSSTSEKVGNVVWNGDSSFWSLPFRDGRSIESKAEFSDRLRATIDHILAKQQGDTTLVFVTHGQPAHGIVRYLMPNDNVIQAALNGRSAGVCSVTELQRESNLSWRLVAPLFDTIFANLSMGRDMVQQLPPLPIRFVGGCLSVQSHFAGKNSGPQRMSHEKEEFWRLVGSLPNLPCVRCSVKLKALQWTRCMLCWQAFDAVLTRVSDMQYHHIIVHLDCSDLNCFPDAESSESRDDTNSEFFKADRMCREAVLHCLTKSWGSKISCFELGFDSPLKIGTPQMVKRAAEAVREADWFQRPLALTITADEMVPTELRQQHDGFTVWKNRLRPITKLISAFSISSSRCTLSDLETLQHTLHSLGKRTWIIEDLPPTWPNADSVIADWRTRARHFPDSGRLFQLSLDNSHE